MAIKLQSLYEAINNQFDVILHTNSFYIKLVDCLEKCLIYGHIRRFAD